MMFGGNDDVLDTGTFSDVYPFFCIKFGRIELVHKFFIFRRRYIGTMHDPFTNAFSLFSFVDPCGNRVNTPVDEHAKPSIPPPLHAAIPFCFGLLHLRECHPG